MNDLLKLILKFAVGLFLLAWLNKVKESAIDNLKNVKNNIKLL